ncbi:unnamed protein product [Urochloa humidicola]
MEGNAGAGQSTKAAASEQQPAGKRVALGDLANVAGGAVAEAAADDEECLSKRSGMEQELLNSRALSDQRAATDDQKLIKLLQEKIQDYGRRERTERELLKLQDIEAKSHNLELELASCKALLSNKLNVSYGNVPEKCVQNLTNLNEAGEVTSLWKELEVPVESANHQERADNATRELDLGSNERDRLQNEHTTLSKQKPASLKDMLSALSGNKKIIREQESAIHELKEIICHQHTEHIGVNEKLSTEVKKVKSLEQEVEQLRVQVASLESKVSPQEYTASSIEVLHTTNDLSPYHIEAKQTVEAVQSGSEKTSERLQEFEDLNIQAGYVKNQPIVIELSDDENTSACNGKDKRSLKSDPSCSVKLGFVKGKHVIEIGDDEYMWSYDDRKRSLKLNPSCRGEPDVETVLDCCGRRPCGSAPCFTCCRHPWVEAPGK